MTKIISKYPITTTLVVVVALAELVLLVRGG